MRATSASEAGGILNRASETWPASPTSSPSRPELIEAALNHAQTLAGDLPLVGWEAEDGPANVEVLGPLRVWLFDARPDRALR